MSLGDFYSKTLGWQDCPYCFALLCDWVKTMPDKTFEQYAALDHYGESSHVWNAFVGHRCRSGFNWLARKCERAAVEAHVA